MNRYFYLIDLVRELKPKHIVEIGTWNGKRATEFMAATNCYYTGFDLFESATKETDKKELNVKPHEDMTEVAKRIETAGLGKFALIRGDTKETLPKWIESDEFQPFEFAWIDGGHSEETISSDFEYIKKAISPGGVIVLDDYYNPALDGFGCNHIEGGEPHFFGDKFVLNDGRSGGEVGVLVVRT